MRNRRKRKRERNRERHTDIQTDRQTDRDRTNITRKQKRERGGRREYRQTREREKGSPERTTDLGANGPGDQRVDPVLSRYVR